METATLCLACCCLSFAIGYVLGQIVGMCRSGDVDLQDIQQQLADLQSEVEVRDETLRRLLIDDGRGGDWYERIERN